MIIDQRLIPLALDHVDAWNFERFGQTFYGTLQDREFVPLGGVHDGGAEGFDDPANEPGLFTDEGASNFLQVSKQEATRKKIRETVKRLREFGRTPKVLTYLTSRIVTNTDGEQIALSQELGCTIRIRDAKFIEANLNSSPVIQGAYVSYLQPSVSHLFQPGAADVGERTSFYSDRTLAVFLRQEVDHRRGRTGLLETVSDSLILWALGETDPDKGIFLDRAAIQERIETTLPSARQFIRGVLDQRLTALASKDAPGGRQVRWYRKANKFCLPFETRSLVAAENAEDDLLKLQVSCVFEDRISDLGDERLDPLREVIVHVCHGVLERVFEHQGLKMAQYVSDAAEDDEAYTDIAPLIVDTIKEKRLNPETANLVRRAATEVLRKTFYESDESERKYLLKLSRTYILLLLLRNEPKIVEYFRSLASNFNLYLGTDIFVRALSEHYLDPSNQTTVNLLNILQSAGAKLILTEKTVEELASHLHRQVLEYENHYEAISNKMSMELVDYIDRLLIRSYFRAHLDPVSGIKPPKNWRDYIGNFATYGEVRRNRGDRELGEYLVRRFGLVYESADEMMAGIETSELEELTAFIQAVKRPNSDDDVLAYNDALHVLRVYRRRQEDREESPGNPFGFKTWWVTQDGKVRRASSATIRRHSGHFFMLRPELLLNYIGFAPGHEEVRQSYARIFPSVLGVRLSARLPSETFESVLRDAAEVAKVDDARAGAMITALTEKLMKDQLRIFEYQW